MGNCFNNSNKSVAEIAPYDFVKSTTTVRLHGSPSSSSTAYLRFALRFKTIHLHFTPAENDDPVIRIGSETASGTREVMLRFIDARFPHPPLLPGSSEAAERSLVVTAVMLQHRSVTWHVDRVVRWGQDLATRGGRGTVDPEMGTPKMEVRKFDKSYSMLLEFMVEQAQMEERVVFPVLDKADRGICESAYEDHARNLPMMNGIKEDIKSVGVLETGCSDYQEALSSLTTRLKTLQVQLRTDINNNMLEYCGLTLKIMLDIYNIVYMLLIEILMLRLIKILLVYHWEYCKEHFEREERNVLPLMEAVELSKEQQLRLLEQCFSVMQGTHSHLFNFFVEGLLPSEAMQYLDLILKCKDGDWAVSMLRKLVE